VGGDFLICSTVIRAQQALAVITALAGRSALWRLTEKEPGATSTLVMVVDDSITVRKVTSRLLERHWHGGDALARNRGLESPSPALQRTYTHGNIACRCWIYRIMPAHGWIRASGHPGAPYEPFDGSADSILITSRAPVKKHRERARGDWRPRLNLGKPYQEVPIAGAIGKLGQASWLKPVAARYQWAAGRQPTSSPLS